MSDVDSIRWMASEHDLEFVDLATYGVDLAAGEIIPESLARQHHVVAIKRKFGTPVIATSDPDDISAQETVRATIGRDFISVVATDLQIDEYLDRLFGNGQEKTTIAADGPVASKSAPPANPGSLKDRSPAADDRLLDEPVGTQPEGITASEAPADEPEPTPANGKTRRAQDQSKSKARKPRATTGTKASEGVDEQEPASKPATPVDEANADGFGGLGSEAGGQEEAALDPSQSQSLGGPGPSAQASMEELESSIIAEENSTPKPTTNLVPEFVAAEEPSDAAPPPPPPPPPVVDELAELARSVQEEPTEVGSDSTTMAADLVAEAVATFQEQQGEEERREEGGLDSSPGTSLFPPLAKSLVDGERVSLEDMEGVLDEHYRSGASIARILTAQKLVTEADLMWGMAEEMGLDFVDLDIAGVDFNEAGSIPEATARHHNVLVIGTNDGIPVVAASNPTDVFAMDDLRTIMGRNFLVVVATRTQITAYIGKVFNSGGDAADMAMEASLGFDGSGGSDKVDDIQAVTEEAPIVRYVNLLVLQALNERASDIHVEPTATDLRIRYRIDGVLHDVSTAPRAISAAVTTRLKVMADLNVAEHRIPQDGRISLNVGSKGIDLRMATLPTIHGEKVVMRVLDKSSVVLGFADLGFDEDLLRTYEGLYTKPYGTILVTGPTGSGKSTTLYTTLTALNSPEKNIITVEDPVELQLKGVNQVQLNVKAGLTFASALKSILRSDPDIVLVGEIRDKETAVIAIEAALTGHMVLSTLHTNSAASTPMRLIEMGIEPFLVTSSLSGVLAQRLTRRLCMHCKEAYEPTKADIAATGWTVEEVDEVGGMSKVYRAVGCSACANTGYRGRKALSELMPMTEEIERMIIEGGAVEEIHRLAVSQGMLTLRQSGIRKAIEGETTLEEVLRVVA
jgi:type IV pilus assembly protein PilB